MADMKQIREAITKHRGGHSKATDVQIRIVWDSLSIETQKQYLDNIKKKGKPDANAIRP